MKPAGVLALFGVTAVCLACSGPARPFGEFKGPARTEWSPDGRTMKLLADFAYVDPAGVQWDAVAGSVVDGASIPRVFWSLVGGPFEGEYRDASIVHDVACVKKDKDWHLVHKMFYNACRCGGVGELEAKILYAAVYHFGPRWGGDLEPDTVLSSEDDFERLQMIVGTDPNVDTAEIERLTPMTLKSRIPVLPPRVQPGHSVLPRFRKALDAGGGREIRLTGEGSRVEFIAGGEADGQKIQQQLQNFRATAVADVDTEVQDLRAQIGREPDRDRRAAMASRLVTLTRERGALNRADVRVKVAPSPQR